jgi:hypothetical protein
MIIDGSIAEADSIVPMPISPEEVVVIEKRFVDQLAVCFRQYDDRRYLNERTCFDRLCGENAFALAGTRFDMQRSQKH